MKENIDYELISPQDDPHEQAWHIRILTGDYVETVLAFGNISLDGKEDCLRGAVSYYAGRLGLEKVNRVDALS